MALERTAEETRVAEITIEEIYEEHIRPLSAPDRLRLLALMAEELASEAPDVVEAPKRSILDFHGVGAHNPVGMDAQEYVNQLRQEWDHRP